MGVFKKTSAIEDRIRQVEKELELISSDLKSLSKTVEDPAVPPARLKSRPAKPEVPLAPSLKPSASQVAPSAQAEPGVKKAGTGGGGRDERLFDYLSTSMGAAGVSREDRRIQRNKALFMLALALVILFLVVYHILK